MSTRYTQLKLRPEYRDKIKQLVRPMQARSMAHAIELLIDERARRSGNERQKLGESDSGSPPAALVRKGGFGKQQS